MMTEIMTGSQTGSEFDQYDNEIRISTAPGLFNMRELFFHKTRTKSRLRMT